MGSRWNSSAVVNQIAHEDKAASKITPQWPFGTDVSGFFANLKLPLMPDMAALMAAQQRNIEAMNQAYQVTQQSGQELTRRHMEIMQQTMVELRETMQSIASPETPQAKASKQAELLKNAYERAVTNMKEFSETIQHANAEALDVLNKRFVEAVNEVKTLADKTK